MRGPGLAELRYTRLPGVDYSMYHAYRWDYESTWHASSAGLDWVEARLDFALHFN